MIKKRTDFLFSKLKFVPQASLLVANKSFLQIAINHFLKRIICQKQFCLNDDDLCHNCQKLKDNCYFDLNWYKFDKNKLMKKQDVNTIISVLSRQSVENNNPKICIIEEIEFSSLEASNAFLKFLETLSDNTFLVFTSTNIKKILPTIQSRCQIFNFEQQDEDYLLINNLAIIKKILNQFIIYDNNKQFSNNFFLIREILNLKEEIPLFFQFLLILVEKKLFLQQDSLKDTLSSSEQEMIDDLFSIWKNTDQLFLTRLLEIVVSTINKLNSVRNLNLNLLLNNFFIIIYQG